MSEAEGQSGAEPADGAADRTAAIDAKLAAAAEKFRAQAYDPKAVRDTVVDAANMCRNLWLAFISFGTYLVIAVGAVTHRDLFLESPVRLPLLNVDLPLVGFFVVAPVLFLIFHAYLLLHLKMMADDVRAYGDLLKASNPDQQKYTSVVAIDSPGSQPNEDDAKNENPSTEARIRQQLPNFVLVRLLAGPREDWKDATDWLLIVIAWITVIVGPLILLLMIQLQFLPYHHQGATWLQRIVILADLVLLWWFWPAILSGLDVRRETQKAARNASIAASVAVGVFCVFIATFPGETAYLEDEHAGALPQRWFTELLFEGIPDEVSGRPSSWFSNSLVLSDQTLIDTAEWSRIIEREKTQGREPWDGERTISLRGRDLRRAVLVRADLRRADFTGARLEDADLYEAILDGARFGCAFRPTSGSHDRDPGCARLTRAILDGTHARAVFFDGADLTDASLYGAELQGSSFDGSTLRNAELGVAGLQGARLVNADLRGAALRFTELQGANLGGIQLDYAWLASTQLQGAVIDDAVLTGAVFIDVQLHGASLVDADTAGTLFARPFVWRANLKPLDEGPRVIGVETGAVLRDETDEDRPILPAKRGPVGEMIDEWVSGIATEEVQKTVRAQLSVLLDLPSLQDDVLGSQWKRYDSAPALGAESLDEKYREPFHRAVLDYACQGDIGEGRNLERIVFEEPFGTLEPDIAAELSRCDGAAHFSPELREELMMLLDPEARWSEADTRTTKRVR